MVNKETEQFRAFRAFLEGSGGTYSFDGESSVEGVGALVGVLADMGLDPMKTGDFRQGILRLFNIELVNPPDFEGGRLLLAPNHVSDVDALVLGLLHPKIRIVSKDGWTGNGRLRQFLDLHYDLYGLVRTSVSSLRGLLKDAIAYFNNGDGARHYLIFSQGTISDINYNSVERVSPVLQKIAGKTGVPVVPVFMEQVSLDDPTRIVFGEVWEVSREEDFPAMWLEREKAMQAALDPPARPPKLSHKHQNNNKPGDPFF